MNQAEASAGLARKSILITRSRQQQDELAGMIRRRGGIPFSFPCLEIEPLLDNIRRGINMLRPGDDVLFTSSNGVHCFSRAASQLPHRILADCRVAAVGKKTAAALRQMDIEPALIAEPPSQQGLIECYQQAGLPKRLIFFRAEQGSEKLAEFLREHYCQVQTIHAYRMRCPNGNSSVMQQMLANHEIDAVLLGSAQTARHYVQRIGNAALANTPVIAVLSEQVAEAARQQGLDVQVVAKNASFDSLLDDLAQYFSQED